MNRDDFEVAMVRAICGIDEACDYPWCRCPAIMRQKANGVVQALEDAGYGYRRIVGDTKP